jgi:VWFA-related protein
MVKTCTLSAIIVFCCVAASLPGLAPPAQGDNQVPKFKARTELVQIPVVAHRGNKHVEGLKVDDFTVLMDGKPQTIAVFEEVHPSPPVGRAATEEFTNSVGSDRSSAERITIIAVDMRSTAPLDQAYLKEEIIKFLDSSAKTGEPFALVAVARSGIRVLQDFTTDPRTVAAAVKSQPLQNAAKEAPGGTVMDITPCARSAAGCGGDRADVGEAAMNQLEAWVTLMTNQERFEIFRDYSSSVDTLVALQQLAQSLRGLPGRKTLVWATSGTRLFGGMSRMFIGSKDLRGGASTNLGRIGTALDQNAHTFGLLSSANIAVYPLDARHGANTSFADYDVRNSDAPLSESVEATRASNVEIIDSFKAIAAATGGKPCFNRTDLANCLQEAAEDSHDYYMIGFYLDKDAKAGWHPISIKLNGPRTELTYRNGLYVDSVDPQKSKLTDLQLALISPVNYTAIPLRGRFDSPIGKGDKRVVGFALDVPAGGIVLNEDNRHLALDIAAVVRGKGGKEMTRLAQHIERALTEEQAAEIRSNGIHYTNKFELPAGDYGVWFVVRESISGRTGSAVTTVNVR